jgi:quinol monooxygenase YgiN
MTQVFLRLMAPSGHTSEILQALEAIRLPAQLDRDCARTQLGVDDQDPDVVLYIEEWLTQDALDRRVASPSFRELLCLLELAVERPTLEFREACRVRGLEYVAAVRRVRDTHDVTIQAPRPPRTSEDR